MSEADAVEGSLYESTTRKKSGEEELENATTGGSGSIVKQKRSGGTEPVHVRIGRTIQTGQYAYARVTIGFELNVHREDIDEGYDVALAVVEELLSREIASIRSEDRERVEIEANLPEGRAFGRKLSIEYGLTIPIKKFESAKVDVGRTEPLADDESLEDAVARLSTWVEARIRVLHNRARGVEESAKDTGL